MFSFFYLQAFRRFPDAIIFPHQLKTSNPLAFQFIEEIEGIYELMEKLGEERFAVSLW